MIRNILHQSVFTPLVNTSISVSCPKLGVLQSIMHHWVLFELMLPWLLQSTCYTKCKLINECQTHLSTDNRERVFKKERYSLWTVIFTAKNKECKINLNKIFDNGHRLSNYDQWLGYLYWLVQYSYVWILISPDTFWYDLFYVIAKCINSCVNKSMCSFSHTTTEFHTDGNGGQYRNFCDKYHCITGSVQRQTRIQESFRRSYSTWYVQLVERSDTFTTRGRHTLSVPPDWRHCWKSKSKGLVQL